MRHLSLFVYLAIRLFGVKTKSVRNRVRTEHGDPRRNGPALERRTRARLEASMSIKTHTQQESTGITGPHDGFDKHGRLDHRYWRCERCGLETTSRQLADDGCWRCGR